MIIFDMVFFHSRPVITLTIPSLRSPHLIMVSFWPPSRPEFASLHGGMVGDDFLSCSILHSENLHAGNKSCTLSLKRLHRLTLNTVYKPLPGELDYSENRLVH
uniref:Uncharacterized protein n=1 Tax=Pyxicephalus adspersus TaxID=30357 RepID=A0AAV3B4I1_PYXAD|nr:TPA: hypothetical protein GDO54_006491 [Pyxicephalus adspersus]